MSGVAYACFKFLASGDNIKFGGFMVPLTAEQRRLLRPNSEEPLRMLDPETQQEYVLLPADVYERLRLLLTDVDPRDLFPALHRAMKDEGWDDPKMDEYNRYA